MALKEKPGIHPAVMDRFMNIRVILWDWNGTLLDDVDVCIQSMNAMLSKRDIKLLSRGYYRKIFTFPVIDYYRRIGWDLEKESWDKVAHEFIDLYSKNLKLARLQPGAYDSLKYLANKGYRQVILSAMEQQALIDSITQTRILHFFEKVAGLGDHYAHSKADIAQSLMNEVGVHNSHVCIIGDTMHDLEVADQIGCLCILVADGHQTYERLIQHHDCVLRDLEGLKVLL